MRGKATKRSSGKAGPPAVRRIVVDERFGPDAMRLLVATLTGSGREITDGRCQWSAEKEVMVTPKNVSRKLLPTGEDREGRILREIMRGDGRHGSCGMGVGETVSDFLAHGTDILLAGDLSNRQLTARKLQFIRDLKYDVCQSIDDEMTAIFDDPEFIDACTEVYEHFASLVTMGTIVARKPIFVAMGIFVPIKPDINLDSMISKIPETAIMMQ